MKPLKVTIEAIDALLPQTQCGDCHYDACRPYAEAIAKGEAPLDSCLPGGVDVLRSLGKLLHQDVAELEASMSKRAKPKRLAVIREEECIGCTKCIQACPVDAIFGASKQMHTVIASECTGCTLCIEPCPMDCIDLVATDNNDYNPDHARIRYQHHQERLQKEKELQREKHQKRVLAKTGSLDDKRDKKRDAIAAALARVKNKKN